MPLLDNLTFMLVALRRWQRQLLRCMWSLSFRAAECMWKPIPKPQLSAAHLPWAMTRALLMSM